MEGSDSTTQQADLAGRVRVVLVNTSLPANIGAAARAMKTMGLGQLVLVSPRAFPHPDADALASGADDVLASARVVPDLDSALRDCVASYALAAHCRTVRMTEYTPRSATASVLSHAQAGPVALVFGTERVGLTNEEIERCSALIQIPSVTEFSSLNLAQAVQVMCYELRMAVLHDAQPPSPPRVPAPAAEMENLYVHAERVMALIDFFGSKKPTKLMRRVRRLAQRGEPDQLEVDLLRGLLSETERTIGAALTGSAAVAARYQQLGIALRLPRAKKSVAEAISSAQES